MAKGEQPMANCKDTPKFSNEEKDLSDFEKEDPDYLFVIEYIDEDTGRATSKQ